MFELQQKPTKYVEPEKWYIAVDCGKCGEGIAIAETPKPVVQYWKIKGVICPHYGHVTPYARASMSCRQGPKRTDALVSPTSVTVAKIRYTLAWPMPSAFEISVVPSPCALNSRT
jgi:hypothetical protein